MGDRWASDPFSFLSPPWRWPRLSEAGDSNLGRPRWTGHPHVIPIREDSRQPLSQDIGFGSALRVPHLPDGGPGNGLPRRSSILTSFNEIEDLALPTTSWYLVGSAHVRVIAAELGLSFGRGGLLSALVPPAVLPFFVPPPVFAPLPVLVGVEAPGFALLGGRGGFFRLGGRPLGRL